MIIEKQKLNYEQQSVVDSLAQRCGISSNIASILYTRGIDTVSKVKRFLSPGRQNFTSPFLFKGMREAVERITAARDNCEKIVIYGDYDADGICATVILYNALKEFGIEAETFVPERENGYGLSEEMLEPLLDEYFPDLIITVDCGISGYKEVEYLKELGVDIIVTDHHELPEVLPDCLIVSCKLNNGEGVYDSLCGAGVAFKLATALLGQQAEQYLDYCMVATIADSMPLLDENRDLVYEGLKLFASKNIRKSFLSLIGQSNIKDINSTSIAYAIAPRINAAGRMGDVKCALSLFLSEDDNEIERLGKKLNEYNVLRQTECDAMYIRAKQKLQDKGCKGRVIILWDDEWNGGILGIVAAKLVEEFNKPTILFVKNEKNYKGSARSVDGINILEAITSCAESLVDFGGHAQAAGVTIEKEKFDEFEKEMNSFLSEKYSDDVFMPKIEVECYYDKAFTVEFADELKLLEPFGTGNRKPNYAVTVNKVEPKQLKDNSPHISFKTDVINMLYFNGFFAIEQLRASVKKHIVFEPNYSVYNGTPSVKGFVRAIETEVEDNEEVRADIFRDNLLGLLKKPTFCAEEVSEKRIDDLVKSSVKARYGTLIAVQSPSLIDKYNLEGIPKGLFYPSINNLTVNVVVGLRRSDYSAYDKIIYLDKPLYIPSRVKEQEAYVNTNEDYSSVLDEVVTDRALLGNIFVYLNQYSGKVADNSVDLFFESDKKFGVNQFIFAVEVFSELKFLSFKSGRLVFNREEKSSLNTSIIYNSVVELKKAHG